MNNNKIESLLKLKEDKNNVSIIYNENPNLRFKETIISDFQHDYWTFDNFDIYYEDIDLKGNFEIYIVYGCKSNNDIKIVRISDKKSIKALKGHNDSVDIVKHFYNNKCRKNYLLSGDYLKIVIVWDLKSYKSLHKIKTFYSGYIKDLLILFQNNYCKMHFTPLSFM